MLWVSLGCVAMEFHGWTPRGDIAGAHSRSSFQFAEDTLYPFLRWLDSFAFAPGAHKDSSCPRSLSMATCFFVCYCSSQNEKESQ